MKNNSLTFGKSNVNNKENVNLNLVKELNATYIRIETLNPSVEKNKKSETVWMVMPLLLNIPTFIHFSIQIIKAFQ